MRCPRLRSRNRDPSSARRGTPARRRCTRTNAASRPRARDRPGPPDCRCWRRSPSELAFAHALVLRRAAECKRHYRKDGKFASHHRTPSGNGSTSQCAPGQRRVQGSNPHARPGAATVENHGSAQQPRLADGARRYTLSDFDYALPTDLIAQVPRRCAVRAVCSTSPARRWSTAASPTCRGCFEAAISSCSTTHASFAHGGRSSRPADAEMPTCRIVATDEAWAQLRASHLPRRNAGQPRGRRHLEVLERDERFFRLRFRGAGSLPEWLEQHGDIRRRLTSCASGGRCGALPDRLREATRRRGAPTADSTSTREHSPRSRSAAWPPLT